MQVSCKVSSRPKSVQDLQNKFLSIYEVELDLPCAFVMRTPLCQDVKKALSLFQQTPEIKMCRKLMEDGSKSSSK